jgi:hypothetical protein
MYEVKFTAIAPWQHRREDQVSWRSEYPLLNGYAVHELRFENMYTGLPDVKATIKTKKLFNILRITYMEISPLPVKGCKI